MTKIMVVCFIIIIFVAVTCARARTDAKWEDFSAVAAISAQFHSYFLCVPFKCDVNHLIRLH